MVRVLIADDHKIVRDGLRAVLNTIQDLVIVDEVSDGYALSIAIAARKHDLDIVFLDLAMPLFPDPVGFVRQTKASYPDIHFVVMTGEQEDAIINLMINAGVDGYLLKTSTDDLQLVIERVLRGDRYLSHEAANAAIAHRFRKSETVVRLSARERDVLGLVVQGLTNEQIADRLNLAEGTIRNYVTRLMEKCDVKNRTALATYALQKGLL